MAYGILKCDNITFDNGGSDQNVTVSGLYRATTSGVTVSGTIAATTVSGVTVIGSTTVSGATVTGTTANFTSGNFSNIISSAATMSGALIMANQQQVQFREAVGNGVNHIALQAPAIVSADQTITLPDQTGTVVTTGDNGSVTSTMILDGTITNDDINASAAIADTKLATISTAGKVSGTAITSGAIATSGDLQITNAAPTVRLTESDGTATHSQTVIARDGDAFLIQTRSSAGVALSNDYIIPADASGATDHIWRIANTEKARIDSAGLTVVDDLTISDKIIHDGDTNTAIRFPAGDTIAFETNGAERIRMTSAGNLLVGTTSPVSVNSLTAGLELHALATTNGASASIARFNNDTVGPQLNFGKSRSGTLSPGTVVQNNDLLGEISFCGDDGTDIDSRAARISCEVDGTPGANDMPGRLLFSTTADGGSSPTERMRITSDGDVRIGNSAGVNITSSSSNGHRFLDNGTAYHARADGVPLYAGRNTNDGTLVAFYQAGTNEGSISVSGSTVSYNPFLGSHWGRLADGSKPDILPGTILDTVDQLIEWKQAKFIVDGEEKIAAYNGPAEVGDTVEIDYEGTSYSAIVQNEEEEPEELNKHVCVKVNDTASSKAVFGVFLGWDDDIPENMVSTWNDLYCAAVGNYFVRIADGETLEIGSLIESDGNGCGIVQEDDIIRSKTVAKITSTIPQKVYDDGSFLVTCVLCCG